MARFAIRCQLLRSHSHWRQHRHLSSSLPYLLPEPSAMALNGQQQQQNPWGHHNRECSPALSARLRPSAGAVRQVGMWTPSFWVRRISQRNKEKTCAGTTDNRSISKVGAATAGEKGFGGAHSIVITHSVEAEGRRGDGLEWRALLRQPAAPPHGLPSCHSLRRPLVLAGRCAASCQIVGSSLLVFFAARLSSVALPPRASLAGVAAQCARALPVTPFLGATDVAAFSALSDRPGRRGLFLLRRTNTFCYHKIFCPVLATISRLRQWVPDRATIDAVCADEGCRVALVKEGRARDGA